MQALLQHSVSVRLFEGCQEKDKLFDFVRSELFVLQRLFAQVVEQVQFRLQFNRKELGDVTQIVTFLNVIGNELNQRRSQRFMHRLNLLQKLVVHKERGSFNYASYRSCVKVRVLLSDANCYRLDHIRLILEISSTWFELGTKLAWKFFVFGDSRDPTLWHSKVNCTSVSLPRCFLNQSNFS